MNKSSSNFRNRLSLLVFVIFLIRDYLSLFSIVYFPMTIFANILIMLCIDLRKIDKRVLLLPVFSLVMFDHPVVIEVIDLLCVTYIVKDVDFKKILFLHVLMLIGFILCWQYALNSGIIRSVTMIYPKGVAYSLGFNNTNGLGLLSFLIASSIFLMLRRKFLILQLIAYCLIAYVGFIYSASRTAFVGIWTLMIVQLLMWMRMIRPWQRWILSCIPVLLFLGILFLTINYRDYPEMDFIFSGRFSIYEKLISDMTPFNWLVGIRIPDSTPMDGSLIYLFFASGLIGVSIFIIVFYKSMIYRFKIIAIYLPFIISVFVFGLSESIFARPNCISIIFWFLLLNYKRTNISEFHPCFHA